MKHRTLITLVVAAALGAAIWFVSPWITGQQEPWDGDVTYYFAALIVTGLIAGVASPKPAWAHYAGNFIGQLGCELFLIKVGPLVLIGVGFLLVSSLIYLAAAVAGAKLKKLLGEHKKLP